MQQPIARAEQMHGPLLGAYSVGRRAQNNLRQSLCDAVLDAAASAAADVAISLPIACIEEVLSRAWLYGRTPGILLQVRMSLICPAGRTAAYLSSLQSRLSGIELATKNATLLECGVSRSSIRSSHEFQRCSLEIAIDALIIRD